VTVVNPEKMMTTYVAAMSLESIKIRHAQSCDKLIIVNMGLPLKCCRREVVPLEPSIREGNALSISKV